MAQTTPHLFQLASNAVGLLQLGEQLPQLVSLSLKLQLERFILLVPLWSPNLRHIIEDGQEALRL